MAITLIGSTGTAITSTINGTSLILTISTGAAASGDYVVAFWSCTRTGLTAALTSSAGTSYTQLGTQVSNGNMNTLVGYRKLTSSETTVSACGTGSAQDTVILSAIVLRGVDPSLTIDFESTTGTTSNPNSPAAVGSAPNSEVITHASILSNTTLTAPSGFGTAQSTGGTDTRSCAAAIARKSTNEGLQDPSSWTGGASAAWVAWTVTLKSTEPPTWAERFKHQDQGAHFREIMVGY